MSEFAYEREMQAPVLNWLGSQGFVCTREIYHHYPIDVVAGRYEPRTGRRIPPLIESVAIELKLNNMAQVLRQATRNRDAVDRSYAAMPAGRCGRIRERARLAFLIEGVGLLAVTSDSVTEIIRARRSTKGTDAYVERNLWRKCQRENTAPKAISG